MSDEVEECPLVTDIRIKCEPKCVSFKKALDSCAGRIESIKEKHPEASCEMQFFDYQACLDKCKSKWFFENTMNYVEWLMDGVQSWMNVNPATFSGAVDILVVPQEDNSLSCTSFHVRFGKLQLISAYDKKIRIFVNDVEIKDINMVLGRAGEAYFIQPTTTPPPPELAVYPLTTNSQGSQLKSNQFPQLQPLLNQTERLNQEMLDIAIESQQNETSLSSCDTSKANDQEDTANLAKKSSTNIYTTETALNVNSSKTEQDTLLYSDIHKATLVNEKAGWNNQKDSSSQDVALAGTIYHNSTSSQGIGMDVKSNINHENCTVNSQGTNGDNLEKIFSMYSLEKNKKTTCPESLANPNQADFLSISSISSLVSASEKKMNNISQSWTLEMKIDDNNDPIKSSHFALYNGPNSLPTPFYPIDLVGDQVNPMVQSQSLPDYSLKWIRPIKQPLEKEDVDESLFRCKLNMHSKGMVRSENQGDMVGIGKFCEQSKVQDTLSLTQTRIDSKLKSIPVQMISEQMMPIFTMDDDIDVQSFDHLVRKSSSIKENLQMTKKEHMSTSSDTDVPLESNSNSKQKMTFPFLEISLCGPFWQLSSLNFNEDELDQLFRNHQISYEAFSTQPDIIFNSNAVFRICCNYYPWRVAASIIMSQLAFGKVPNSIFNAFIDENSDMSFSPIGPRPQDTVEKLPQENPAVNPTPSITKNNNPGNQNYVKLNKLWGRLFGWRKVNQALEINENTQSTALPEPLIESYTKDTKESQDKPNQEACKDDPFICGEEKYETFLGQATRTPNQNVDYLSTKKSLDSISISPDSQPSSPPCKSEDPSSEPIIYYTRSLKPTSKQLLSFDLKPGLNKITFTVDSPLQDQKKVESSIYLWERNVNIVISDIDGTITRSDVLGHLFPVFGKDWSHNDVAALFSSIKKNGYKILYLSARSIGTSRSTKEFLISLRQGSANLPDGPVFISPDRLLYSLNREVILRRPELFKTSCLNEIKRLFGKTKGPGPFYSGFGNRPTDAVSYMTVGIPPSKIFTINPLGQISCANRSVRHTYKRMNDLVEQIFPSYATDKKDGSTMDNDDEQWNDFNYWETRPQYRVDEIENLII